MPPGYNAIDDGRPINFFTVGEIAKRLTSINYLLNCCLHNFFFLKRKKKMLCMEELISSVMSALGCYLPLLGGCVPHLQAKG